ncbi:YceI family protein [Myroides sp. LJL116]
MKKIVLSLAIAATLTLASCGNKNADTATTTTEQEVAKEQGVKYVVDTQNSYTTWKVGHTGGIDPRWGKLSLSQGEVSIDQNGLTAGNYILDMNTITVNPASVGDDEKKVSDLTNHLKSVDFFDIAQYPTVTFQITKVEDLDPATESKVEGANKSVSGNLTILGKTVNTTFPAKVTITEENATLEANFIANRTDWGLKFGTKDEKGFDINPADWGISKDMEIGVFLIANKQK